MNSSIIRKLARTRIKSRLSMMIFFRGFLILLMVIVATPCLNKKNQKKLSIRILKMKIRMMNQMMMIVMAKVTMMVKLVILFKKRNPKSMNSIVDKMMRCR